MTTLLLLSSSFLSQMTALLLLFSSFMSQIMALRISSSFLSQWLHLKPSLQRRQQQLRQWLKSPQQELQQRTRQEISLLSVKQLKLNTRQEAQAFCIPSRKRLTMQHKEISCCILFKTIQQFQYQVFCCLTILNAQQLRQQRMPIFHFSWLSSYYPQEPNKLLQPIPSFIWLLCSFEGLRLPKPLLISFQFWRENIKSQNSIKQSKWNSVKRSIKVSKRNSVKQSKWNSVEWSKPKSIQGSI